MPRFTATLSGSAPNQVLTVLDTLASPSRVVLTTNTKLHDNGGGGGAALAAATIFVKNIEREFDTPIGTQKEMGFDLLFRLTASGSDKEVGQFVLSGLDLGSPIDRLNTNLVNEFFSISGFNQNNYPGDMYAPIVVLRKDYNICVAMCYKAVEWGHAMHVSTDVSSGAGTPTAVRFKAAQGNGLSPWFQIPAGQTRTYRMAFRINDQTSTPVSTNPGAPDEWIWTLRGYQQFFRTLYGKPNYRSMGGWDGRPCYARYMADGSLQSGTNPRGWKAENDPTVTGGYNRLVDRTVLPPPSGVSPLQQGFKRLLVWAMSGWPDTSRQPSYAFKIMTGIGSLPSPGPQTLNDMRRIGWAGMRQGYWWGTSTAPPKAAEWNGLPAGVDRMDPSDPTLTAKGYAELDRAIESGASFIGLDAFEFENPRDAVTWARILKARGPRVYFVTEQMMPDYLHVLMPTYVIETSAVGFGASNSIATPHHLSNWICPGAEVFLQAKPVLGVSPLQRAVDLTSLGYTPLSEYALGAGQASALRAFPRWPELGESSVAEFNRGPSQCRVLSQRIFPTSECL